MKKEMVKVVLKMKTSVSGKIRKRGMLLGTQTIELRPRVFEYDKKELEAEMKTKKFDHYMEVVEVTGLAKMKVGDYTDGKKSKDDAKVGRKEAVADNKLKELNERESALEKREADALAVDKDLVDRDSELTKREDALVGKTKGK